ncbi:MULTISPECIES: adaptor protein MecA [unclassified Butyrivibrio]|uniref:adaptor protein MecA n=1 Tax=unclassified Butyrivibrio TaxID=2639466 RepID=UPI0003B5B7D9|nr:MULTISPECIES: adaptor protein MecA [unclassified Butyrivibrio]MDC7294574.1 adaptor protein MecA [Butyrivibrio sp. DSM 10294]
MKIEKVNDHQIRCTLTRDDLAKRDLKITELAYGTDKAKELFQDMMQQANLQYGFDAEDTPLMIEAIPINSECIVLIITKVEDPEELDTRFSNFAPSVHEDDEEEDEYYEEDEEYDEAEEDEDVMGLFKRLQRSNMSDFMDSPFLGAPDNKKLKEKTTGPKKKGTPGRKGSKIFSFGSLHEVTRFAGIVSRKFDGINTLYKNEANGKFYLILHQGNIEDGMFANICSLLTEYGKTELGSTAEQSYLDEHFTIVIKDNAVQALSKI